MSDLTVGRLTATVANWPDSDPDQVPVMLRHVADSRLQDAVRAHPLPDGEWCVRRVAVDVELDPERPASALEADWADQIVIALRHSLRSGSQDIVRYERREQALDDLLAGLATGDHDRAWAWRQVGILATGDPEPGSGSRELCLRVLERMPYGVAAALTRLVGRVGVAAAHRLLGSQGWATAADLAAGRRDTSVSPLHAAAIGDTPSATRTLDPAVAQNGSSAPRAAAIASLSPMAVALRGSALRPDDATLRAWAVLVMAGSDPSGLRGPGAGGSVEALAELLRPSTAAGLRAPRTPPRNEQRGGRPSPAATETAFNRDGSKVDTGRRFDDPTSTAPPPNVMDIVTGPTVTGVQPEDAVASGRTAWGGLLFLLNTAADAGLPDSLDEPLFVDRPTPWLVRQLGVRLVPAMPGDPAVLAFSGVDPDLPDNQPSPDDSEAAALDRCAARWVAATAARLRSEAADRQSDLELVRMLARRDATVVREPGWVEVVFRLDDVDLDVRRSGLDIDPAWVWWLGQVVRFLYE